MALRKRYKRNNAPRQTKQQILEELKATKRKTDKQWENIIFEKIKLLGLCDHDKDDLTQIYETEKFRYGKSLYIDLKIRVAINQHLNKVLDYRRLFTKDIDKIPQEELDGYLPIINEGPDWDDFNFNMLNSREKIIIEKFWRFDMNLTEIAEELGDDYVTTVKRFERAMIKIRDYKDWLY